MALPPQFAGNRSARRAAAWDPVGLSRFDGEGVGVWFDFGGIDRAQYSDIKHAHIFHPGLFAGVVQV